MGRIIDGKALAAAVKDEVRKQVEELEFKAGRKPCLVVIVVGDNPDSQIYVRNKVKVAASLGMNSKLIEFPSSITEEALLGQIFSLNNDSTVDGILVQLPLPDHIDEEKIINVIDCDKDVDGFHPMNVAGLWLGKDCIIPCTPAGIIRLIDSIGYDLVGKNAVVVGRSNIVGKPVAKLLLDRHATVTIAHSRTADLESLCQTADVLVSAVGKAGLIDGKMIKLGAIVIDVGMNHTQEGKLCGDVDFASVQPKSSWITPVPGGVGPMTIAMLMKNTLHCYMKHNSKLMNHE